MHFAVEHKITQHGKETKLQFIKMMLKKKGGGKSPVAYMQLHEGEGAEEMLCLISCQFWLFVTPWSSALQASLSITNSQGLLMTMESVMPSNH